MLMYRISGQRVARAQINTSVNFERQNMRESSMLAWVMFTPQKHRTVLCSTVSFSSASTMYSV